MDGVEIVREYYRSIDSDEYGALADLLTDGFVQYRPDTRIEGRDAFVSFMRDDRPERGTDHDLNAVYSNVEGPRIAAEGRLLRADGEVWFGFVDTFEIDQRSIRSVRTYTDLDPE